MRILPRIQNITSHPAMILLLSAIPASAWAYTPESPEVTQMLERATEFLSGSSAASHSGGGDALIGMAMYKAGVDKSHEKIQTAIKRARDLAKGGGAGNYETYSPAVACIFLCEIGPDEYREDINRLVEGILKRQHANGSWSYSGHPYDDTSQTQYGVLCLWMAHNKRFDVPVGAIERATRWLIQAQDASGGWCYKPMQSGSHSMHNKITPSMSAAGAGSLYMCAHYLGYSARGRARDEDSDLPPALRLVEQEDKGSSEFLRGNRAGLVRGLAGGDAWFSNNLTFNTDWWTYYYMYGLERYKSFQELVQGETIEEPDWYNRGVEFLRKTQKKDGSWDTAQNAEAKAPIKTSFAVLFLTRSSKKTIQEAVLDQGILIGGKGLPKNTTNIAMQDGKVVTPQMIQDVDELLKMLEDTDNADFDVNALDGYTLDDDLNRRNNQLVKLREMVSDDDYEKRLAAVTMLAGARELANVPALIYALDDPNPKVAREARDGLRFISRKFGGYGLTIQSYGHLTGEARDKAVKAQKTRAQAAQAKWSKWYLSILPEGELMH